MQVPACPTRDRGKLANSLFDDRKCLRSNGLTRQASLPPVSASVANWLRGPRKTSLLEASGHLDHAHLDVHRGLAALYYDRGAMRDALRHLENRIY